MIGGSACHGGNPRAVRERLGLGSLPLLDFSVSLNPLGPPPAALDAAREAVARVNRYPVPGCPDLTNRLARLHGLPADHIMVGAGTSELIGLVALAFREAPVPVAHLFEPSYAEYRRASVLGGLTIQGGQGPLLGWTQDDFPTIGSRGIFWTGHPGNPTGRAWDRDVLLRRIDEARGLLTVVDESFLPFFPDEAGRTLAGEIASRENLLVLRSLTKIYAFPGLRIGYALGGPDLLARLRQRQTPWSVSPTAEAAALAALDEGGYLERTRSVVAEEASRMLRRLWDMPGLRPVWPSRQRPGEAPPLPNFLLVSLIGPGPPAGDVHDHLARAGLLVRDASNFPGLEVGAPLPLDDRRIVTRGHLRLAVRTAPENDLLLAALERGPGGTR